MSPIPSIPVGTTVPPGLTGGRSRSRALSTGSRCSGTQAPRRLKTALGGWELSGIALFESGTPSHRRRPRQPRVRRQHQQPGEHRLAGHLSGDPVPVVQHLVVRQAGRPSSGGSAARNDVVGPGTQQLEHRACSKRSRFKEHARFEFRAETFNTFNHTQFTSPSTQRDRRQLRTVDGHLQPAHLPVRREVPVLNWHT